MFGRSKMKDFKKLRYYKIVFFVFTIGLLCIYYGNKKEESNLHIEKAISHDSTFRSRHLLSVNSKQDGLVSMNKTEPIKCARPDIEQFPKGFINQNMRRHGAVIIHFIIAIYMFVALAIVCDEYFVTSLNFICKKIQLREDVAGATLMAAGSSAPELATTLISLFIAKDVDIGIGTVVGSAVFNIMFIISLIALLSGVIINLNWYPLIRDSSFYLISIFCMILVIFDGMVYWYEALFFIILYALYIVAMLQNARIEQWCHSHLTFFGPTTIKSEFIQIEGDNYNKLENEMQKSSSTVSMNKGEIQSNKYEAEKPDLIEHDSSSHNISPLKFPSSDQDIKEKARYYICWPIFAVLYFTIPNCKEEKWQKLYALTFCMSLVWLCIFSYIMVWMITIIGYTFLIPDTVMGFTLIAFGSSVPDALNSVLVAKSGHGDMAVSNAIGSNVFDILVCLGVPWFLRCLTSGSFIRVKSKGLKYSSITLFGTVVVLILSIKLNKWQLDKKIGIFLMCIYLLFILLTAFYESSKIPMCDSKW